MILLLVTLIAIVPLAMLRAYVLIQLLGWFTPFDLTLVHAMGVSLLIAFLTYSHTYVPNDERSAATKLGHSIGHSVVLSLSAWGFGALYHAFM